MTRDDPELGQVKQCTWCREEWPADAEFFYTQIRRRSDGSTWTQLSSRCKACWNETRKRVA